MAEVLVATNRGTHTGREQIGRYHNDDPVCVKPDGHRWGTQELNPRKFYILRFPGEAVERVRAAVEEEWLNADGTIFRRRKCTALLTGLQDKDTTRMTYRGTGEIVEQEPTRR